VRPSDIAIDLASVENASLFLVTSVSANMRLHPASFKEPLLSRIIAMLVAVCIDGVVRVTNAPSRCTTPPLSPVM
jgi:hypothetical protein